MADRLNSEMEKRPNGQTVKRRKSFFFVNYNCSSYNEFLMWAARWPIAQIVKRRRDQTAKLSKGERAFFM
jgi:hypothetical protein